MDDRNDVTVPMPGPMVDAVEKQLNYGDSRAGWIREAVRLRLEQEGVPVEEDDEGNVMIDEAAVG